MENDNNQMRPEYDFTKMTGGVRGKYYKAYRQGHTVKIHNADGTTTVQHFKLEERDDQYQSTACQPYASHPTSSRR